MKMWAGWALVGMLAAAAVRAEDVRLANGLVIKGQVARATDAGLEVQTPAGSKTYAWETLSWGTRYRYQPSFRANLDPILKGLPPAARTNEAAGIEAAPGPAPEKKPAA